MAPMVVNIDRELEHVKAALLYADKVTLISPVAYLYTKLRSNDSKADIRQAVRVTNYILPFIENIEPELYSKCKDLMAQLSPIVYSKQYKAIPYLKRLEFNKAMGTFLTQIDEKLSEMLGTEQISELNLLLKSEKLVLQRFEHSLGDTDGCISEYFRMLTKSIKSSYPLFDELSSDLMSSAIEARIVRLSDVDRRKITHASLSDNFLHRLPSFETASVDEILDIRKELNDPLIRFRSKMIDYSDTLQSLPWDQDFEENCSILYSKEVAPAVLEIEELTKENGFLKNLGREIVSDDNFFKSTGGLVIGIAAAGIIPTFTQTISSDTTILAAGGTWAATKVADAYAKYAEKKRKIEKKDLFFYYKAGNMLEKLQ